MLASKVKRQPEGSTAKQCAFLLKRTDSPPRKQKQPQKRLFFVNDEQKGASFYGESGVGVHGDLNPKQKNIWTSAASY